MRKLISAALVVLMALGLMLSLSTVASANPTAGGGYSSSYAGESVFTNNAAGETGQFSAIFFNDGQVAWSPGVVGLLICAPDKVTCNVSQNASYAKNWFSATVYATASTTVAPGQNGFFIYNFTVPSGTPGGTAITFYGDVGLIATGAELRPQGYFQTNTTPVIVANLVLTPSSLNVALGATQQFTVTGQGTNPVTWTVIGGCGAITSDGLFVSTATNAASQPCMVQASAAGSVGTANVTVYGPASQLACAASPATVVANGGTGNGKTTATITLKDSNGTTVANASTPSVTVTNVTPSLATATPTGSVSPVNGVVTVAVASTLNPGTIQLSATATGLTGCNVQIPSTSPGASSSTTTTFTINPIAADGVSTTTLRAEVTDSAGNRNTGDNSTTLSITRDSGAGVCNMIGATQGTGASIGPGSSTVTVVQGRADITVQSTSTPGSCTFTTSTNNTSIAGSSGTLTTQIVGVANRITVTSNDTPKAASGTGTCTVAGSQAGTNTNISCTTIVIAIRDANGSLITSDSGRAITASFDSGTCTGATPGNATQVDSAHSLTSSGSATLVFTSAGAYPNCRITFSSGTLTGTSTTATWTGGAADHLTCSFSPNPIPPNGQTVSVGTVAVRDSVGNVVTTGSYSVSFSRTSGAATTFNGSQNPQTTNSGYAYFTVQSGNTAGTDTYTPTIASGATLPGANQSCSISVQ